MILKIEKGRRLRRLLPCLAALLLTLLLVSPCAGQAAATDGDRKNFAGRDHLVYFGLGAQRTVSGSLHILETGDGLYLLDVGSFFGGDGDNYPWPPELPVAAIRAVFISHAHADHVGRLPLLLHEGYRGPIYLSRASYEIIRRNLAANLHLADLGPEFFYYSRHNQGRERIPVYLESSAGPRPVRPENRIFFTASRPQLNDLGYYLAAPQQEQLAAELQRRLAEQAVLLDPGQAVPVDDFTVKIFTTPHILGSVMIKLIYRDDFTVLFSGDVGADGSELLSANPRQQRPLNLLLVEGANPAATQLDPAGERREFRRRLAGWLAEGKRVVIPAFALDRSQQVIFEIGRAVAEGLLPADQVVRVCGPAANEMLALYADLAVRRQEFAAYFQPEVRERDFLPPGYSAECQSDDPANPLGLHHGEIGVMPSGTGEYAAARQALAAYLEDPQTVFHFVSHQPPASPGGRLTAGARRLQLDGRRHQVRAKISRTHAFSGHAAVTELQKIFAPGNPEQILLVHLPAHQADNLVQRWQQAFPQAQVLAPAIGERFMLVPKAAR